MSNISKQEKKKQIIFLTFFPIIPAFLLFFKFNDTISALTVLALFWSLSMISIIDKTKATLINYWGHKIIKLICDIVAAIALFFVYIAAIIPSGFIMKLVKRDRLKLKSDKKQTQTYWNEIHNDTKSYEYQF